MGKVPLDFAQAVAGELSPNEAQTGSGKGTGVRAER